MECRIVCVIAMVFAGCTGCTADEDRGGEDESASFGSMEPDMEQKPPSPTPPPSPEPPPCESTSPPPRCLLEAETFDAWGDAAIVTSLVLEGTENEPICCAEMTGDGEIDNALGMNFAGFGWRANNNDRVDGLLSRGPDAMVLEIERGDAIRSAQWWTARWGPEMLSAEDATRGLHVTNAEAGVQSGGWLSQIDISEERIRATSGTVILPLFFLTTWVWADAEVADLDLSIQDDGGLSGTLGAYIRVSSILDATNATVAANCDCLGLGEVPLINRETGECSPDWDARMCDRECTNTAEACNLFGAAGLFADVDADGDGLNEAVSAGYLLELQPAEILGLAP